MDYTEFEKAVDTLGLLTKISKKELREKYLKLSKKYHPDMQDGSDEKFKEIKRAYDILNSYIDNYQYSFDKEEFQHQFPSFYDYKNWNKH